MDGIQDLLQVLTDKAKYEKKIGELNSKIEEESNLYKKVQAERGKLQLEKEELEALKIEMNPKLEQMKASAAVIAKKEETLREISKLISTLGE